MRSDFVVLGASGTAGRLIADELSRRGASVVRASRHGATPLDLTDPDGLRALVGASRVVINTVGPFARLAPAVVAACLDTGTHYVDIGNERAAVRAVLDQDVGARERGVTLVTGAGFGVVATESLVMALVGSGVAPAGVAIAAAASSAHDTPGVRATVAETMADGAVTYVGGHLVRASIGSGATTLTFGGTARQVVPVPVGDLEAARRITGAGDVIAYAAPRDPTDDHSHAYAAITDTDGTTHTAELTTGEGFAFTTATAVGTALRLLDSAKPGAWTPCHLFGTDIADDVPGTTIHIGR